MPNGYFVFFSVFVEYYRKTIVRYESDLLDLAWNVYAARDLKLQKKRKRKENDVSSIHC